MFDVTIIIMDEIFVKLARSELYFEQILYHLKLEKILRALTETTKKKN